MKESNRVALADEIGNARRIYKNGLLIARNSMLEISSGKNINIKPVKELIHDIIHSLERNPDALLCISRIKPLDDFTTSHSLSTCIYIAALTLKLDYTRDKATQVILGALLGDVGKLRISKDILNKPGKLTEKEYSHVQKHAKYTYALLYASKSFSERTIRAATEHHERLDGSGYPFGLEESQISRGGQMTAIADVYDALASPRLYRDAKSPQDIYKLMCKSDKTGFHKSMLKKFIRMVGMYPVGSVVALSNAKLAVVVDHGKSDILLPMVKTVFDLRKKSRIHEGEDLDLEELNQKNGLGIIRPLNRDEFNFNPLSAIA